MPRPCYYGLIETRPRYYGDRPGARRQLRRCRYSAEVRDRAHGDKLIQTCQHTHYSPQAAQRCADRMAHVLARLAQRPPNPTAVNSESG